ncbi:MAG: alpha/beta hydrolase [Porticoccaceae bacterium]|nr:alpha/beta hydrolase [Porticoccaceae bacterium]
MSDFLLSPAPGDSIGTLMLAHGAGAPMDSDFMAQLTAALNQVAIDVVRFEFPYMRQRRHSGGKRPPDRQPVLLACWQQNYQRVIETLATGKPLCVGGKSMGGRMATLFAEQQFVRQAPVAGVCCFGYPFFTPGKAGKNNTGRVEHLLATSVPTLIVQGTRDPFGKPNDLEALAFSNAIEWCWLEAGDHDFRPTVRSGIDHQQHFERAAGAVRSFFLSLAEL